MEAKVWEADLDSVPGRPTFLVFAMLSEPCDRVVAVRESSLFFFVPLALCASSTTKASSATGTSGTTTSTTSTTYYCREGQVA